MVRSIVHARPAKRFIPLIRWNAKKQAIRESVEPAFGLNSLKIPPPEERLQDLVHENFDLRTDFWVDDASNCTQVLEVQLNRYHPRFETSFVLKMYFSKEPGADLGRNVGWSWQRSWYRSPSSAKKIRLIGYHWLKSTSSGHGRLFLFC